MNENSRPQTDLSRVQGWQWNLLLFGVLVLIVLGYFYWQAAQARRDFVKQTSDHSRMLAGIISSSLSNAQSSQQSIEQTIHTFLANSAKFVDYLDSIEPFSPEELLAFAKESNLAGITIQEEDGRTIEGPAGWAPGVLCQTTAKTLSHRPELKLYLLNWPRVAERGCLVIGFASEESDRVMEQIGIERLIRNLSSFPLIDSIFIEEVSAPDPNRSDQEVLIIKRQDTTVAETRLPFGEKRLVVRTDASPYVLRLNTLKKEFILFALLLTSLGLFFSWLLYRYQLTSLQRAQNFERQIAKQHEEAALGRSAAIISHEIRNPLNAIGMGLQRLEIEAELPEEQRQLIASMRQAVARTTAITAALKQVTQPMVPHYHELCPQELVAACLTLYRGQCQAASIRVEFDARYQGRVEGDETLMAQLIENLCKNAIEAQPGGGYIHWLIDRLGDELLIQVTNPGLTLTKEMVVNIMEPYFTTKTHGTGLGLAVCRRIVEAHNGRITPSVPEEGCLRMTIKLPIHHQKVHS